MSNSGGSRGDLFCLFSTCFKFRTQFFLLLFLFKSKCRVLSCILAKAGWYFEGNMKQWAIINILHMFIEQSNCCNGFPMHVRCCPTALQWSTPSPVAALAYLRPMCVMLLVIAHAQDCHVFYRSYWPEVFPEPNNIKLNKNAMKKNGFCTSWLRSTKKQWAFSFRLFPWSHLAFLRLSCFYWFSSTRKPFVLATFHLAVSIWEAGWRPPEYLFSVRFSTPIVMILRDATGAVNHVVFAVHLQFQYCMGTDCNWSGNN